MIEPFWKQFTAFIGVLAAIAAIFYKGKAAGKSEIIEDQKDELIKTVKKVKDVEKDIIDTPDSDVAERLQRYYRD